MPQLQLPMFPVGVTPITSLLAFIKEERGVAIFAIDFSGRPARKISKNHATANAFGGPDSSCLARFDPTRGQTSLRNDLIIL